MKALPTTGEQLIVGQITATVAHKPIRRIYLRVTSATGPVHLSVPRRCPPAQVESCIREQIPWIERQQARLRVHEERAAELRRNHQILLWGRIYTLEQTVGTPAAITSVQDRICCAAPASTPPEARGRMLDTWLRARVEEAVEPLVVQWSHRLGIAAPKARVRRMRSRWGSCSPRSRTITINLELAGRPPACLEYIVVHELLHYVVQPHNTRFYALLDHHLPRWEEARRELHAPAAGT
jgi:predicted metal-dependent hydrolase